MKHALRSLAKSPGFTLTALATLALCLGANLTIFAVVDSVLLRSLPFPNADRLVTLYYTYPKLPNAGNGASLTSYYERRGQIPALSSIAEIALATSVVGDADTTSLEAVHRVTPEFFATLGIPPFMGREFNESELTYPTDHVAIISHEFWCAHFHADPKILGQSLRVNGIPRLIVGVLPPHFRFLSYPAPVFLPLASDESERNLAARHQLGKIQIARLAPGATLADAQAQIDAHDAAHAAEYPEAQTIADAGCRTIVAPLHADHVASAKPMLLLLQAGALLLAVIGAVNLVNLLLIRASGRVRELAIRQALGASQRNVIREAMTETFLLTALGGALGVAVAAAGIKLLSVLGADRLPLGSEISFGYPVGLVAMLATSFLGLALGVPIAWFNLRTRLAVALQSESRGSTVNRATQRLRHGFIVAQIALAFVLLAGASLLGLSLRRMMQVSPGFRSDHVITGHFLLTWRDHPDLDSVHHFFDRLHENTRSLPGVTAVGAISNLPLAGATAGDMMTIPGHTPSPSETLAVHNVFGIAGDYFAAMGIPLQAGRFLTTADAHREQRVCVVDEAFARRYWPNQSALGQQLFRGTNPGPEEKSYTVVGVVGAVKQSGLNETSATGSIYLPYSQVVSIRNYFVVVRTRLAPESIGTTLIRTMRNIDPDVPLTDLRSMEMRISDSLSIRRSPALVAGIFATVALLLATIGLYGAIAYSVAQLTQEFGIRMALGAQRGDVLRLVLGQGFRLALFGLVLGLAAALLLTDSLSSLLFAVAPNDPLTLAAVAALLAFIALLACWLPAHRATRVDPMIALRAE